MNISQVIEQFGTRTENGAVIVSPKAIYARTQDANERAAACNAFNDFVASLRKRTFTKRVTTQGNDEFTFDVKPNETLQVKLVSAVSDRPSKYGGFIKDNTLVFDKAPIAVPNISFAKIRTMDEVMHPAPVEEDADMQRKQDVPF